MSGSKTNSEDHLKPFGYAPGHYMIRCHACDGVFDFMDKYANTCKTCAEARWQASLDGKLAIALEALEKIAFAGMSGSGVETEEDMVRWHARRAWQFIGIAARAVDEVKSTK